MSAIVSVSQFFSLIFETLVGVFTPPFRLKDLLKQIVEVANKSFFMVIFCVAFAAAVTIIEASYHMKLVIQTDSLVPGFAAMLIIRELGAVVMALLLAARVGAGMSAELGTMKISEQIDALRLLQINPVQYLVVPRFLACAIAGLSLSLIANVFCLYCAMLVSTMELGFSQGSFFAATRQFIEPMDLFFASIKGLVFGSVIPFVSAYFGFKCEEGAEGVGRATTSSVVVSSVIIIVLDFVMTFLFASF